jgi:hypothetical protein
VSEQQDPPSGEPVAGLPARIGTIGRRLGDAEEPARRVGGPGRRASRYGAGPRRARRGRHPAPTGVLVARAVGGGQASLLWELAGWVDEVLRECYPEAVKDLGSCWYRHLDIVNELIALRSAWLAAYQDKAASATAAIEWHDRWLPGAMAWAKAALRARGCKSGHEQPPRTAVAQESQDFKTFIDSL